MSAIRDCVLNTFAASLHPQAESEPCRGDRDPRNMDSFSQKEQPGGHNEDELGQWKWHMIKENR
jgi:hypothetical protein